MSYHNITTPAATQSTTNAQGQTAPAGYHYMPDGTLMLDADHKELSVSKIIRGFDIDFNDIKEAGETRRFSVSGDNGAKFSLEVTNEDNRYYNFQTNLFQAAKTKLDNISISGSAYYGSIVFPLVTDADKYDFVLSTGENTQHSNYNEVRFGDNSIDINSSTGSNSNILKKVIYQTLDVDITINGFSGSELITSYTQGTQTITTSRGKSVATIPLSITVSVAAGALTIDRQPVNSDIFADISTYTIGANPVDIPGENIYPTATTAFTGDDINGAITSGAIVRMDNTDLSAVIKVGDKITTPVTGDAVNGAVTSGVNVIMDTAVAAKMAVGDRVTGNAVLDAGVYTVAAINVGSDANTFALNEAVALIDDLELTFSSKINRSLTTVTVVETSGTATDFTMSQNIQFRDNAPLTFFNRRNYRWPINNMHLLTPGMRVKADATTNGFTGEVTIADYLDETIAFENDPKEQRFTNVKVPAIDTLNVKPTITRNATTNVVATTQTGNITFTEQALKTLGGETIKIFGYGMDEINRITGYDVEFTDLKAELNTVTTTTTAAVSASTTIPVTSKVGIVDKTTQTVNGAITASANVVLDSVTGLGIGQSLYAGSGLVGTPTITAINETTKTITLSTVQTFADGITLTFPNSIISGIGIDPAVVNPYVDTISSLNLTASVAQTLEDAQTFTFTGAGNIVTITGFVKINKVGNDAVALRFDIDKFLTQH